MSRLTIEVSSEQHQNIKIMAALKSQSIKDFIIERVFPDDEQSEQAAWEQLKVLLQSRLDNMRTKGASPRTVQEITASALQKAGKL